MLVSMRRFVWMLCLGLALCVTIPTAEAKGILIINTGEDVFETGPLPASIAEELPGAKAGYRCSVFGVFWAYIATWGCTPVAYIDNGGTFNYNDEADVVKAISEQYPPSSIKMGFWAHHGRWLMLAPSSPLSASPSSPRETTTRPPMTLKTSPPTNPPINKRHPHSKIPVKTVDI